MDTVDRATRSRIMSSIRSVSRMELAAKPIAEAVAGCRLANQPSGIFGKPDYGNKSKRVLVFVHGCFFHGCPRHFKMPKSNTEFWARKIARNKERHKEVVRALRKEGWTVITIWECHPGMKPHRLEQERRKSARKRRKDPDRYRKANNALNRRWNRENPEARAAINQRWRGKNPEKARLADLRRSRRRNQRRREAKR